jgi:hypothetical protein
MKDIEQALSDGVIPWTEIEHRTTTYWIFDDNHRKIIAPVSRSMRDLTSCYTAAYHIGYNYIQHEKWSGFTVKQSVGAVNEIQYPYIELIPG